MEIQNNVRRLKLHYALFWALPVLFIFAGEFELFPLGTLVDDERGTYLLETIGILIIALSVPVSLKLFSWVLAKKIDSMPLLMALKRYSQLSALRLGLLEVAIMLNLYCYYATMNAQGALCALIGLTASLFCIPSEKRMRNELHITIEEE